jgi:hypothetical protein
VALDKFIGASVPVSAYWSGENCLSGYQPAPLGREGASMVAIDDGGAVLFGGKGTTAQSSVVVYFNDVHVLDIKSGAWIRLPTTGSVPPGSAYHSAVGWSNATNGAVTHMTIFGGDYDGNVKKFNADVYTLELRTGVWTKMKTTGAAPDGRNAHTAVSWTPAASSFAWKMTIFGGELPSVSTGVATAAHPVFAGTATTLDLTTGVWTAVTTTGAPPSKRGGHSAVVWTDPTSSVPKMTIFGGFAGEMSSSLDDAFTLDLSTNEWTAVSTTGGASPSARSDHSAVGWVETSSSHGSSSVAYEPKLAIFGGQNRYADVDVDVHILNLATGAWNTTSVPIGLAQVGTRVTELYGHTAAASFIDPASSAPTMVIFGGRLKVYTNEVQTITVDATGGTWGVTFKGSESTTLAALATADDLRVALEGLSTIGAGGVVVTKSARVGTADTYKVTFSEALSRSGAPSIVIVPALTGGAGTAEVTETTAAENEISNLVKVRSFDLAQLSWAGGTMVDTAPHGFLAMHSSVSWRDEEGAWQLTSFGGCQDLYVSSSGCQTDVNKTTTIDLNTGDWSGALNTTGTAPSARHGHTAVSWTDASGAPKMTVFGGRTGYSTYLKDTYTLTLTLNVWSRTGMAAEPYARVHHSAVSWQNQSAWIMTIYGGEDENSAAVLSARDDVHHLNLLDGTWSGAVNTTSSTEAVPPARCKHSAVSWINESGAWKMTIFGGESGTGLVHVIFGDVYTLDLATGVWNEVVSATPETDPRARRMHSAISWSDRASGAPKMTVFGGAYLTGILTIVETNLRDVRTMDLTTGVWSTMDALNSAEGSDSPKALRLHTAVGWRASLTESDDTPRMTISGGYDGVGATATAIEPPLYTATLISSDAAVAITNNDTDRTYRALYVSHKVADLDTLGLTLRAGSARGMLGGPGTPEAYATIGGTLFVEFNCATHTIGAPVEMPLQSAITFRCVSSVQGCCELVCSTGVCFQLLAPMRLALTGLRLRSGTVAGTSAGAAIQIEGSSSTKSIALSFLHFSAFHARALVIKNARGTLAASVFENCYHTVTDGDGCMMQDSCNGGALLIYSSSHLDVTNCTFRGNGAKGSNGGAIAVHSSSSLDVRTTFCTNNFALSGGCIYAAGAQYIRIESSTIDNNNATEYGGGVRTVFSPMELHASSVSGNRAGRDGGGLHLSTDVRSHINSTEFIGNRADKGVGGAFRAIDTSPSFHSSAFRSNTAANFGGLGLVSEDSRAEYTQCTFDGNTPAGTNGAGNACAKGKYSTVADDTAQCTRCPINAIAPSSGAEKCDPCEMKADELRLQCLVRVRVCREPQLCAARFLLRSNDSVCASVLRKRHSSPSSLPPSVRACAALRAQACPKSTYVHLSGDAADEDYPCTACPARGVACAEGKLLLDATTWYSFEHNADGVNEYTEMHTCFNDECCINTAMVSVCDASKGYFGPLCGACNRDNEQRNGTQGTFTRSGRGCLGCWRPWASWLATVALGGVALVGLTYLVVRHDFAVQKGDYGACCAQCASPPLHCAMRPSHTS